jgi:hypothetical protein
LKTLFSPQLSETNGVSTGRGHATSILLAKCQQLLKIAANVWAGAFGDPSVLALTTSGVI